VTEGDLPDAEKGGNETGGSADPGDVNQLLREELA
jgi:hypothetical protein